VTGVTYATDLIGIVALEIKIAPNREIEPAMSAECVRIQLCKLLGEYIQRNSI
jgi:hypothetical protein